MLLILLITFFIIYILTILYYVNKKIKLVDNEVICCYSLLSIYLYVIYRISKQLNYIAIVNPFTKRIHLRSYEDFIYINENTRLFKHETEHIKQIRNLGAFIFIIKYIYYYIKYGYDKNPFEIDARRAEII